MSIVIADDIVPNASPSASTILFAVVNTVPIIPVQFHFDGWFSCEHTYDEKKN